MGTLKDIGALPDKETFRLMYRNKIKQTLSEGGLSIMGAPIPLGLPPLPPAAIESQIKAVDEAEEDFDTSFSDQVYGLLEQIDNVLPASKYPSALLPVPAPNGDPTWPLLPIIQFFMDLLLKLGITADPPAWIMKHLPPLMDKADPLIDALKDLSTDCNPVPLAEILKEIDPNFNVEETAEALKGLCPFEFNLGFPAFSFPPSISLSFDISLFLNIPGFLFPPNLSWPNINWLFQVIWLEIILGLIELAINFELDIPMPTPDLPAWLIKIIEAIIMIIIGLVIMFLAPLLAFILFAAVIITIIFYVVTALIVCLLGLLIGAGLIVWSVAYLLGMLSA